MPITLTAAILRLGRVRPMSVIVRYDSGFPTKLLKQATLVALLKRDGPPSRIDGDLLTWTGSAGRYAAAWSHRLPGCAFWRDGRKVVSIELGS